jgi:flagellar biosynthesis/type III secretory pathway chaperone
MASIEMYWQELPEIILQQQFYYQSNGDINKARTYIDKALEMSAENHFIFYARDH